VKRIPFLIIVFMLTTGFFKSALEECADESFEYSNSIPSIEYKTIELSDERYKKLKDEHERSKKKDLKKHYALPICKNSIDATKYDMDSFKPKCRLDPSKKSGFTYEELLDRSFKWQLDEARKVKTKEYTKSEMKKKYKKFFKKSLKTKMNNNKYYENYSSCVAYKKRSPELFEAKYD
jgi:hypothetical protein